MTTYLKNLEVVCPNCGHHQMEPSKLISTNCRSCGCHISLNAKSPEDFTKDSPRLATDEKPPIQHEPARRASVKPKREKLSFKSLLRKLFSRTPRKRKIDCFHCGYVYEVVDCAQSSQCPKCSGYISLENYDVSTDWRRSIQTRGDVIIQKEGSIIGVKLQCHDLTVLGKLSASVHCSGTLRIRSQGKIIGNVTCNELLVERGAVVDFQGPVITKGAYINGEVKAQITCHGSISLGKNSHLQGVVRARALIVREGAKHTGTLEVIT